MKSLPAPERVISTSRKPSARAHAATIPPAVRGHAAANDDDARSAFDILKSDPLWAMAIGMGVFFGLMAALIAFG